MKHSKIVLGALIAFSILGIACNDKYSSPNQSTTGSATPEPGGTSPSPSGSGIGIISTPRPDSDVEESSPPAPSAFSSNEPFIIGRSASPFSGSGSDSENDIEDVVPSKISGTVYGYNFSTKSYTALGNATVVIDNEVFTTDSGGRYTTSNTISEAVSISAKANGFASSTVSKVTPGVNRNIHLQPTNNQVRYNPNTITMEFISLAGEEPTAIDPSPSPTPTPSSSGTPEPVRYPSEFSFGTLDESRFISTVIDKKLGRHRLEVNLPAGKTASETKALIYDVERDAKGNPTNPTQMKNFILKDELTFRVGDTSFPAPVSSASATPTPSASTTGNPLLTDFVNIHASFHDRFGFSNFICNAYVIMPDGEKILASRYSGGVPTNVSFRLPKVENASYRIEAHAGNTDKGSDVVINDLHEDDSVVVYLLNPPEGLSPGINSVTGANPEFGWSNVDEASAYQVEVKNTSASSPFVWEGYSWENSIKMPSNLHNLIYGNQYNYQVIAMDFSFSGLKVMNKAERLSLRAEKIYNLNGPKFNVKLANPDTSVLPRGYRASYNTVLFRAK